MSILLGANIGIIFYPSKCLAQKNVILYGNYFRFMFLFILAIHSLIIFDSYQCLQV